MKEAVEGHSHQLKWIEIAGHAVAKLVRYEIAGDLAAVDAHAVVADDQVESILCQDPFKPFFLLGNGPQKAWNTCDKCWQKESRVAVGRRIILEEDEITIWAFSLQEGQGIAACADGYLMSPLQKLLNNGNVSGSVAQTPIERTYKNMSHEPE